MLDGRHEIRKEVGFGLSWCNDLYKSDCLITRGNNVNCFHSAAACKPCISQEVCTFTFVLQSRSQTLCTKIITILQLRMHFLKKKLLAAAVGQYQQHFSTTVHSHPGPCPVVREWHLVQTRLSVQTVYSYPYGCQVASLVLLFRQAHDDSVQSVTKHEAGKEKKASAPLLPWRQTAAAE